MPKMECEEHEYLFNGSQPICINCLQPKQYSDEEIKQELEARGYSNERASVYP